MRKLIHKHVPRSIRDRMRRIYYLPVDTFDAVFGRRDSLTPPRGLMFVGRGDFRETGEEYLNWFVDFGGLKPSDRVLDVGCGIGQMAVPLTRFFDERGSYEGFDVVPEGIAWCRKKITPRFQGFRFQLADIYNKEYNPGGRVRACEFRFPYAADSFDFVFLTSVFTHMLPMDVEHYLREIHRVLRVGKPCFVTFFLMPPGVDLHPDFKYNVHGVRSIDSSVPEKAIAYEESYVRGIYSACGLEIVEPTRYGVWRETRDLRRSQDIFVAVKG